nr:sensor domain-containing diguanylate cyclase [Pseudoalteromonas caenipelagi]
MVIINRSLLTSMDKLTEGASKFANGDTHHSINIGIPIEIASVAHTFNSMKNKISEQHKTLELMANVDGLTGLLNRRKFDELIAQELISATHNSDSLSVILADIDHFKRFNDTYGHQGGDEALKQVANTLKSSIRDIDKACRYGGEEFIVLLPQCNNKEAMAIAERLRSSIEELTLNLGQNQTSSLTASFGIATYPVSAKKPEQLVNCADQALYKAKNSGRNRVSTIT